MIVLVGKALVDASLDLALEKKTEIHVEEVDGHRTASMKCLLANGFSNFGFIKHVANRLKRVKERLGAFCDGTNVAGHNSGDTTYH
jgi:hypothetical protein